MTTIRFRRTYLTPSECARRFVDDLLERRNLTESMSSLILPSYLSSLLNIAENYLEHQRSLFLSIVAEIGSLCSQKSYDRVHYLISVLDELMDLHQEEKYRAVIENYLETIVYADLTDHFISYPIQLQVQIMSIVENSPILQFPLIRDQSESDQSKIDLFLQDAGE